jgi:GTP-binding protein
MFVDVADIIVKAGDGGDGMVSFFRDKNTEFGGPDGGNGGCGGCIVFVADRNLSTLSNFSHRKEYRADGGENGGKNKCSGKNAKDLVLKVPFGTVIKNSETCEILADLCDYSPQTVAFGGHGGAGNMNFATSVKRAPRYAKPGGIGERFNLRLELKLLADVGLIGLPNAGKSSLISRISGAKPKIADYPFTTLNPILGVVLHKGKSFVVADIPGIIENASRGAGLGFRFLRHIQRCKLLIHMVDISQNETGAERRYESVNRELFEFDANFKNYPMVVVGSKSDIASKEVLNSFENFTKESGIDFLKISAATGENIKVLLDKVSEKLGKLPQKPQYIPVWRERGETRKFEIKKENKVFSIRSEWLEKTICTIDFDAHDSLRFFRNTLDKGGVTKTLEKMGAKPGDTVKISGIEFDFLN